MTLKSTKVESSTKFVGIECEIWQRRRRGLMLEVMVVSLNLMMMSVVVRKSVKRNPGISR
jgi:hypothetical protein